jgi:hypothetical protein
MVKSVVNIMVIRAVVNIMVRRRRQNIAIFNNYFDRDGRIPFLQAAGGNWRPRLDGRKQIAGHGGIRDFDRVTGILERMLRGRGDPSSARRLCPIDQPMARAVVERRRQKSGRLFLALAVSCLRRR